MVKEIKIKLSKLLQFLKDLKSGIIDKDSLVDIKHVLEKSFQQNVLNQPHEGGVYEIPTQSDLETLIESAGAITHKPSRIPREAHYNKDYLRRKQLMNQGPHTYMNLGIVQGTKINVKGDGVVMSISPSATIKKGYNYGVIQEQKKSFLKSTVYWAWEDIIKAIMEKYIDYLI